MKSLETQALAPIAFKANVETTIQCSGGMSENEFQPKIEFLVSLKPTPVYLASTGACAFNSKIANFRLL